MAKKANYKIMAMTLRIVVPPHPLIGHWLTILRNSSTPASLYATGLEQLGRWLSYEAIRDWLPYRKELIQTELGSTEGIVIESRVPLIAVCKDEGGFHLCLGAREVLPNTNLYVGKLPASVPERSGILLFMDKIGSTENLLKDLRYLEKLNVQNQRVRIITALVSSPGLKEIGEIAPDLTIYTSCIDEELNDKKEIIPGIGEPKFRLNTRILNSN